MLELIPHLTRLRLRVDRSDGPSGSDIRLGGAATFVTLPRLAQMLDTVPADAPVRLDVSGLHKVDHTTSEMLRDWLARRRAGGSLTELTGAHGPAATVAH